MIVEVPTRTLEVTMPAELVESLTRFAEREGITLDEAIVRAVADDLYEYVVTP